MFLDFLQQKNVLINVKVLAIIEPYYLSDSFDDLMLNTQVISI